MKRAQFGMAVFASGMWVRGFGYFVRLKSPRWEPLFSERNGIVRPVWKAFGWRLFVEKIAGDRL